uniref:Vacuolar protein sorting-associated protein 13 VPS13 adaptor binding domain-containing protein n=1 Tax=Meleagris gallopavo TaxID=9103 RepID=A0A803Y8M6_MELGA
MELVLMKYQGKNWNGHLKIHEGMPEFFSVCFTSHSATVMTVDLYIHIRRIGSRVILSVFSPYWIINKTSRILQYRAEDIHVKHPAEYRDIVLFSFKKKNIFSKNKIQLSISTSTWSNSFSLDTVGSYGCVRCSAKSMEYLVGVSIKMSSFNLTRIVTFTPFYTIANKSSLELECLPFWPENSSGELCVRVVGFQSVSKPFLFQVPDNGTLLRLEELTGGLLVEVNVSEHSTLISFSDYHEGAAPALIVNHTSWDSLRYKQSGLQEEMELKPKQVCLFAWTDPTKTRKLAWSYSQSFGEHDLLKDECGQFPYNANTQIHWVSFLDGRQRVLLFTDDVALVSKALQVDNQLPGSMFPVVFHPVAPPKSISKLIQQDVDALSTELMETSLTDLSMLSFFELFHISPIKLHLSLSLASGGEASEKSEEMIAIHSLNLLLKSIGATLTDVDDLIFKLAYFEIKYQFYKRDQLMKRAVRHYSEQFLKQMYVLVLGLDVLGNPFGLIRGLSEGVEAFFYEPFQGAVQGPEEFAEGFVIGVRSLLGHTVGGAAGVVSRITGSVGKGLAAITMDKEYQQKRREEMGRQPRDFSGSLAKGGKGFLRGVVGGVTGIITKPVEGAKKEGAAGFFKGIGKGLVGVVARPTGGIVDMASSTFQGIQRVAESTEEVPNLRPPRFIHEDGIIRPYNRVESLLLLSKQLLHRVNRT